MTTGRIIRSAVALALLGVVSAAAFASRSQWLVWLRPAHGEAASVDPAASPSPGRVLLTDQAIGNLRLESKPLKLGSHWKSIVVPGAVVGRPGVSDQDVVVAVAGVVAAVHCQPGDTVRPGDLLFTLNLQSESLHQAQAELFKARQDVGLAQAERRRLAAASQAVGGGPLVEVEQRIARLEAASRALRHELATRGLTPAQIAGVEEGTFATQLVVRVPSRPAGSDQPAEHEVQELRAELGQQVQGGQTLVRLVSNARLAVEGRAFADEARPVERAAKEGWPVAVDFLEPAESGWRPAGPFTIRQIGNTIDPASRTFPFLIDLTNEARVTERSGRRQNVWRYRPGQRVRITVPVERLDGVFVLPAAAVGRNGAESFVFTQNVNTFERKAVRELTRDRAVVVIANDGSVAPGAFVVQSAAAQLDRMVKAASASGAPRGYHVHADGSLHKNEDEGK
jgi:pyruvate/2-oxoglutarate dehydrogenase complex dihydrolipoamide acyltransferase (E2) component